MLAAAALLAAPLRASPSIKQTACVVLTGGAVMTRLHEPPHPSSPSPRQPALMIGWSELEALLLNRLPPGTVVSAAADLGSTLGLDDIDAWWAALQCAVLPIAYDPI